MSYILELVGGLLGVTAVVGASTAMLVEGYWWYDDRAADRDRAREDIELKRKKKLADAAVFDRAREDIASMRNKLLADAAALDRAKEDIASMRKKLLADQAALAAPVDRAREDIASKRNINDVQGNMVASRNPDIQLFKLLSGGS